MPLHDYRCRFCGRVQRDVYRSIAEGARDNPPTCLDVYCAGQAYHMDWIPQVGRMDASSGSTFVAFDTQILQPDGSHKTVHVSSLRQLRSIERDSEDRARNGEGQRMIWRDFSQDRTNADVNTMGPDPAEQSRREVEQMREDLLRETGGRHRGAFSVERSADEPSHDYGPGVSDDTTSSLGGLDG